MAGGEWDKNTSACLQFHLTSFMNPQTHDIEVFCLKAQQQYSLNFYD